MKNRKRKYRNNEPTYYSFFFLGLLWIVQFSLLFIASALVGEEFTGDMGIAAGIWHVIVLLIAAYEDLHYDEHHLPWVIVLAVIMNSVLAYLASFGMWMVIALIATLGIVAYIAITGGGALGVLVAGSLISGVSLGTIIMVIFIVMSIITGVTGRGWFL